MKSLPKTFAFSFTVLSTSTNTLASFELSVERHCCTSKQIFQVEEEQSVKLSLLHEGEIEEGRSANKRQANEEKELLSKGNTTVGSVVDGRYQ